MKDIEYAARWMNDIRKAGKKKDLYLMLFDPADRDKALRAVSALTNAAILIEQVGNLWERKEKIFYFRSDGLGYAFSKNPILHYDPDGILFQYNPQEFLEYHILFNRIVEQYAKQFRYAGIYTSRGKQWIVLSSRPKLLRQQRPAKAVVILKAGYGDLVMLLPILKEFIEVQKQKGIKVEFLTTLSRASAFLHTYLPEIQVVLLCLPDQDWFNTVLQKSILAMPCWRDHYFLTPNLLYQLENTKHITSIWRKYLRLPEAPARLWGPSERLPEMDERYKAQIEAWKMNGAYVVAFQFLSNDAQRSLPQKFADTFCALCRKNKIRVVNPVRNQKEVLKADYDLSELSFSQLIPAFSRLDAVVGIDGCCGHIAGALGIPNITVWVQGSPTHLRFGPVGFRALSANYSIVLQSPWEENELAQLVFERLLNVLNQKLKLTRQVITIEDSVNGYHVEVR